MVGLNRLSCHIHQLVQLRSQESPALNLTSKPQSLAKRQLNKIKISTVRQGVSINHIACGKHMRLLASYNKILKQLLVKNKECHSLDQEEGHSQLPVLILETCELFTMPDGA